jgi:hypothetical protein
VLVRGYGQFWNPDIVSWSKKALVGTARPPDEPAFQVNVWKADGIYILYRDFRPVYVGKAATQSLGVRLEAHLGDRLSGRWDMFSFYITSTLNRSYQNVRRPGGRHLNPKTVIDTLESLVIGVLDPPLNRRHEKVPGATLIEQPARSVKSVRSYLQEILESVQNDVVEG